MIVNQIAFLTISYFGGIEKIAQVAAATGILSPGSPDLPSAIMARGSMIL
jgi:hypothetical protein